MRPHPRIRKTIKWCGAAVTVLLVVVWIGSGACLVSYGGTPIDAWSWTLGEGGVAVDGYTPQANTGGTIVTNVPGWEARRTPFLLAWGFKVEHSPVGFWRFFVPLWIPVAGSMFCTAIAYRLDILARRRARLATCPKCNYDRTGLARDAQCPECGSKPT